MKLINKLVLATVVSLGVLLLPIAADTGFSQCYSPNGCSVSEDVPEVETSSYEKAPAVEVIPAMGPIQGGTFWHKSHKWGSWWQDQVDYGKWWNWNDAYNWNNRYNWNDNYADGSPAGDSCYGGTCGPSTSYQSGPSYGGGGYGGPSDLGGFDSNPYWNYSMGSPSSLDGGGFTGRPHRGMGFAPDRHNRFGHMGRPDRDRRFMPGRRDRDDRFGQMRHPNRGMRFSPGGRGQMRHPSGDRRGFRHTAMGDIDPGVREWQTVVLNKVPGGDEKTQWSSVALNQDKIESKTQWVTNYTNDPVTMYTKVEWETTRLANDLDSKTQWVTKKIKPIDSQDPRFSLASDK